MAVLIECPVCHRRISAESKRCKTKTGQGCGYDIDKAKKANKVVYWIAYRLAKQKQPIWERIINDRGESHYEDAVDVLSKRRVQRRDHTVESILDIRKAQNEMTFQQLTDWYLQNGFHKVYKGEPVKHPENFERDIKKFNVRFWKLIVSKITEADLEKYQNARVLAKIKHRPSTMK